MTRSTFYAVLANIAAAEADEVSEIAARLDSDNDPMFDTFQNQADALFARADMFRDKAAA